jgi:hypothetical protein
VNEKIPNDKNNLIPIKYLPLITKVPSGRASHHTPHRMLSEKESLDMITINKLVEPYPEEKCFNSG